MKKILVIKPKSIAGELIMDSFASGFEDNKCLVMSKQIDEITDEDLKKLNPDLIIGYDYSHFMDENCQKIIERSKCKNLAFYFGDEPKSKFALGDQNEFYEKLKQLDPTVFVWDRAYINDFEKCYFLPLAASPYRYATEFTGYKYPITFVGRPLTDKRQKILSSLIKAFNKDLNIFCFEKHFLQSVEEIKDKGLLNDYELEIYKRSWKGFIKTEEELAKIYNSSEININITEQGEESLNYRVYEVLAANGFLLTDEKEDLDELFTPSKNLETYKNEEDLIDKINFYTKNLNIAQKIAQLGRIHCGEYHTFSIRAKFILEKIFD